MIRHKHSGGAVGNGLARIVGSLAGSQTTLSRLFGVCCAILCMLGPDRRGCRIWRGNLTEPERSEGASEVCPAGQPSERWFHPPKQRDYREVTWRTSSFSPDSPSRTKRPKKRLHLIINKTI